MSMRKMLFILYNRRAQGYKLATVAVESFGRLGKEGSDPIE